LDSIVASLEDVEEVANINIEQAAIQRMLAD